MINTLDLIVVEYSPSRKEFHRQTVFEMTNKNITILARGGSSDWLPISLFTDIGLADRFINDNKKLFEVKRPNLNIENKERSY